MVVNKKNGFISFALTYNNAVHFALCSSIAKNNTKLYQNIHFTLLSPLSTTKTTLSEKFLLLNATKSNVHQTTHTYETKPSYQSMYSPLRAYRPWNPPNHFPTCHTWPMGAPPTQTAQNNFWSNTTCLWTLLRPFQASCWLLLLPLLAKCDEQQRTNTPVTVLV